ncbi:MAG TPA: LamG-like jellyroll fold domain-containing protein [Verrucomicrobiae bacterium]|nr:LamG-like jellyroll fold domain-containing protein [Verrucomicrobiae bacterium]
MPVVSTRRSLSFATAALCVLPLLSAHASFPPNASVELNFSEGPGGGDGITTTNSGSLSGLATFKDPALTNGIPAFSTNVPAGSYAPSANGYSVDMGLFVAGAEGHAVDLETTANPPGNGTFGATAKLTVCGWVNARTFSNRGQIAYALETVGGLGFSLAVNSVGALGLGINENASEAPASLFRVPTDSSAGSNNWIFVAATYDPELPSDQLKYYFGRPDKLAFLESAHTYVGGDVISSNIDFSGPITIGNASSVDPNRDTTSNAGNPLFRGLIDEIKVYTNALTLDEIQQAQINGAVTPVAASILRQPSNKTAPEGQSATFDVDATGSGLVTYQWKINGVDVSGATNATFTLEDLVIGDNGKQVSVGVTNSVGGVLSSTATLSVTLANPHLMYLSYVEGTDRTTNSTISAGSQNIHTANAGALQGGARFKQQNSSGLLAGVYPVFGTSVPTGPFAPNPTYNRFSLNMGSVIYTNDPRGLLAGSQGQRWLDFTNSFGSPADTLGSMEGLTICGWLNAGSLTFRPNNSGMGNQIVFASAEPSRSGFALSHKADWSLQLSVNEWPGGAGNRSFGIVRVVTDESNNAIYPDTNWVFFAVTYDGTLATDNLNYYFGDANTQVTLDAGSPQTYNKGIITNTGPLTVGNVNAVSTIGGRTISGDNAPFFRGFIDELHVFNRVLSLEEIQQMQVAPALPAYLLQTPQGNNVELSWEQGQPPLVPGLQLQSNTNLTTGTWVDVTNPTNVTGSVRSLTLPTSGDAKFFRLRSY